MHDDSELIWEKYTALDENSAGRDIGGLDADHMSIMGRDAHPYDQPSDSDFEEWRKIANAIGWKMMKMGINLRSKRDKEARHIVHNFIADSEYEIDREYYDEIIKSNRIAVSMSGLTYGGSDDMKRRQDSTDQYINLK